MQIKTGKIALLVAILIALSIICLFTPSTALVHGPLDEQIAAMTKQISLNPNNAELYLQRGELHRHHLDWDAASADYDSALILNTNLDIVDMARGMMMSDAGRFKQALIPLNRYLAKYPDHPNALLARARVLVKLNQNLAAAENYTQAIAHIETPTPELFIERGKALSFLGAAHLEEAINGLDEGLKILGPIVTIQLFAIELERRRKNYDAALTRLELISAQSSRKEKWLMRRGQILQEAARITEARDSYLKALQAIESFPQNRRKTKSILQMQEWLKTTLDSISVR